MRWNGRGHAERVERQRVEVGHDRVGGKATPAVIDAATARIWTVARVGGAGSRPPAARPTPSQRAKAGRVVVCPVTGGCRCRRAAATGSAAARVGRRLGGAGAAGPPRRGGNGGRVAQRSLTRVSRASVR